MENTYLDFDLIRFPDGQIGLELLKGDGKAKVLLIFKASSVEEDYIFLANVLKAAQLTPMEEQVYQLALQEADRLPLTQICRQKDIEFVLIFGCDLNALGIRATLPAYEFVRLGEVYLLWAHDLTTIRIEREQNKNQKAGLLWQALKARFL